MLTCYLSGIEDYRKRDKERKYIVDKTRDDAGMQRKHIQSHTCSTKPLWSREINKIARACWLFHKHIEPLYVSTGDWAECVFFSLTLARHSVDCDKRWKDRSDAPIKYYQRENKIQAIYKETRWQCNISFCEIVHIVSSSTSPPTPITFIPYFG